MQDAVRIRIAWVLFVLLSVGGCSHGILHTSSSLSYDLLQQGIRAHESGQYESSISYLNRALDQAYTSRQFDVAALCLEYLADANEKLGHYEASIALYERSLQCYERHDRTGTLVERCRILGRMGDASLNVGRPDAAVGFFSRALSTSEDNGLPRESISSNIGLGVAYRELRDYGKSLHYYFLARRLLDKQVDSIDMLNLHQNLSEIYSDLGDAALALVYLDSAVADLKSAPDDLRLGELMINRGTIFFGRGLYRDAWASFDLAGILCRESPRHAAKALSGIGDIEMALGHCDSALSTFCEATEIIQSDSLPVNDLDWMPLLLRRGWAEAKLGRDLKALASFDTVLFSLNVKEVAAPELLARAYHGKAEALTHLGQDAEAFTSLLASIRFSEDARSNSPNAQLRALFLALRLTPYEDLLDLAYQINSADLPQTDNDYHTNTKNPVDRAVRLMEMTRSRALAEVKAHRIDFAERDRAGLGADTSIERKQALLSGTDAISSAQIALALRSDEVLLEYKATECCLYIACIGANGDDTLASVAVSRNDFNSIIEEYNRLLHSRYRNPDRLRPLSSQLVEMLILPVEGIADHYRNWIIVPDDAMFLLPFETLFVDRPEPTHIHLDGVERSCLQRLCRSKTIRYYHSATMLLLNRRRNPAPRVTAEKILIVADPAIRPDTPITIRERPSASLASASRSEYAIAPVQGMAEICQSRLLSIRNKCNRLPAAHEEALAVAACAAAFDIQPTILEDTLATEEILMRLDLSQYDVLHFATHAMYDTTTSCFQEPAILLSIPNDGVSDGLLTCQEVENLNLDADLVILSACNTGQGRRIRGEGIVGLSQAFLLAGARTVLVTLWEVGDEAQEKLLTRFYQELIAGAECGEALRVAKLWMMDASSYVTRYGTQRAFDDTYYWAPFIQIGG